MLGEITKYRDDLGFGVIMTDDGRRYRFARNQVISAAADLVGQEVDFIMSANQPAEIIVLSGPAWTAFGGIAGTA
jgi:cold shock CspA family protein